MIIEYNGCIYNIPKENYESNNLYLERLWFVAKQEPNNYESYKKTIEYSKLWKNIKYLNCKYSKDILTKVKDYEKNLIF